VVLEGQRYDLMEVLSRLLHAGTVEYHEKSRPR